MTVRVGGDLLRASEAVVAHQCNCVSFGARGVAKAIFAKWPEANAYARRRGAAASEPGTLDVARLAARASPPGGASAGRPRGVVGLFAQRSPGPPKASGDDSAPRRLAWFQACLEALAAELRPSPGGLTGALTGGGGGPSVAMPYLIGCGLAGGHWPAYRAVLEKWAARHGVSVVLYDKDSQSLRAGR